MTRRRPHGAAALVALAASAAPTPAAAHLVGVEFGDFYAGFLHVYSGVEHIAALTAIALLAALQPPRVGRWALVCTPPLMLLGAAIAQGGAASGVAGSLAALSAVGLAAAVGARLSVTSFIGLVAACAVLHGYVNGRAADGAAIDMRLYASGVAVAGGVAVTLGAAAASVALERGPVARIGARAVASWLAALGLIIGALQAA